jgi:hypothetical protein
MELTQEVCALLKQTAGGFHGVQRRRFMAQTVEAFGLSQRQAELRLGWARATVRKAVPEASSGIRCVDNFSARGRKPAEFHWPDLLEDICEVVKENLQTDPTFQTTGLYCRLSGPEVRNQLIERKGYTDKQLPTVQTLGGRSSTSSASASAASPRVAPKKSEGNRCPIWEFAGGASAGPWP